MNELATILREAVAKLQANESLDYTSEYAVEELQKAAEYAEAGNYYNAYRMLSHTYGQKHLSGDVLKELKEKANEPIIKALERLGGDKPFILAGPASIDGEYGIYDREHIITSRISLKSILEDVRDSAYYEAADLEKSLDEVLDMYADGFNDPVTFFGTEEKWEEYQAEKRRKELERAASLVASKHNVRVNSIEFLKAVQKEINRVQDARDEWNNPEVRMEEFAACQYAGVGTDVYFDDLNFENGRYGARLDELYGIMEWVSENCPLLYTKYENQGLEEKE